MRFPTVLFALALISSTGCGVTLKNLTPSEFPINIPEYFRELLPSGLLGTPAGNWLLVEKSNHRFKVEVERRFVTSFTPWITLNGVLHPMSRGWDNIWYYDSPNQCNPYYKYNFTVAYKVLGSSTTRRKHLFDDGGRDFIALTTGFGSIVWFSKETAPVHAIDEVGSEIAFHREDRLPSSTIIIQNLSTTAFRLESLRLVTGLPEAPNSDEFEIYGGVTTLPRTLDCGDRYWHALKWNPPSGSDTHTYAPRGALKYSGHLEGVGDVEQIIYLVGHPMGP